MVRKKGHKRLLSETGRLKEDNCLYLSVKKESQMDKRVQKRLSSLKTHESWLGRSTDQLGRSLNRGREHWFQGTISFYGVEIKMEPYWWLRPTPEAPLCLDWQRCRIPFERSPVRIVIASMVASLMPSSCPLSVVLHFYIGRSLPSYISIHISEISVDISIHSYPYQYSFLYYIGWH